jgi:hypothetical protein
MVKIIFKTLLAPIWLMLFVDIGRRHGRLGSAILAVLSSA